MKTFGLWHIARPVASKLAWQRTMTFLDWHLKGVPAR